ncbi:Predicted dithiol-disulfide isomerase, DsbA family [Aliiroseovarius halocynthiae]|uniref:DsbA family oxidoreductase n=1 Tax=Aliiroseovarius halocynthiae TaxID=985055 RepID=A0A545SVT4_9RHOB|nr:DsbA family oxidoreductase [Aliiroseovarius halocynthiae]TQV69077.1 DsbA family oxidoreductase [Aliiroseovarius halocynthiae]SMR71832.1 Predicted dithiol-disulfide isomerase, DsbA family [Aliiroseovarius halocynthiae]
MIRLDIFSDPICPWCYIGKTRLDFALESRPDHPFQVHWHPFQLNPEMPPEGMDRRAYLEGKFGGKEKAVKAYLPVIEEAAASGLDINLEAIKRTPNTMNAHRLIHWAGLEGKQNAIVDRLFRGYFVDGKDIGQADVLCDIAAGAGMDADMVKRLLDSSSDASDLLARDMDARHKGVNSVPTFLIANQHVVPGAQPIKLWQQVIDDITAQLDAAETEDEGPAS